MNSYSCPKSVVSFRSWRLHPIFLGLFVFLCASMIAAAQSVRLNDDTDWWSLNNPHSIQPDVDAKGSKKDITAGMFEIAGVVVGSGQFSKLAAKMGKAQIVERGDAAYGREQVCYVAAGGPAKVYLVFEYGEDQSEFYLFSDGATWTGQNLCVRTKLVSMSLETRSGLRLGLSRAKVELILGKADAVSDTSLVYSREVWKKTTPAQFATLRRDYPGHLSDPAAHKEFDYIPVDIYIEARFGKSGMNYLAVSRSAGIE